MMTFFKQIEWKILGRIFFLFATLLLASFIVIKGWYLYLFVISLATLYQLHDLYRFLRKPFNEWSGFVESIHYRDFSRYFEVRQAAADLQPLRQGFNEINSTFKALSKEKETQYQYLQKILELVDTGILSYQEDSGEVVWMNESLKNMLQISYLKTIGSLAKRDNELYLAILALKPKESKVCTAHAERTSFKILISASSFQTDGVKYKLIAFQNVNEALEETESKAWEKLLNVMTHEIMNSIAPISSLADTLKNRLQESMSHLNNESGAVDDLELGINTIKKRSEGLLKFAETYRNLNKINSLNLKKVYLRDLFESLINLMQPTLLEKEIEIDIFLKDPDLQLDIDTSLMEQALINLTLNSIEALKNRPHGRITISGYVGANHKTIIKVADNGAGMPQEVVDKIFIPFFSTKKSGSGIGLSLCKQIMQLHRGNITVQSAEGEGTAFVMQF